MARFDTLPRLCALLESLPCEQQAEIGLETIFNEVRRQAGEHIECKDGVEYVAVKEELVEKSEWMKRVDDSHARVKHIFEQNKKLNDSNLEISNVVEEMNSKRGGWMEPTLRERLRIANKNFNDAWNELGLEPRLE